MSVLLFTRATCKSVSESLKAGDAHLTVRKHNPRKFAQIASVFSCFKHTLATGNSYTNLVIIKNLARIRDRIVSIHDIIALSCPPVNIIIDCLNN